MSNTERAVRLQSAIAQLQSIGMDVRLDQEWRGTGPNRSPYDVSVVNEVNFGLSLQDWSDLTRRDGDAYIGGCCGAMSHVQDVVNGWWREGDWIPVRDLQTVSEAMRQHDCGDDTWSDDMGDDRISKVIASHLDPENDAKLSSWGRIAMAWYLLKDFFDQTAEMHLAATHLSEADLALRTVGRSSWALSMIRSFERGKEKHIQEKAFDLSLIARIRPALVTLLAKLNELGGGPVEGFAIEGIRNPANGELESAPPVWDIVESGMGLALFPTLEEALEVINSNVQTAQEYEGRKSEVRKLRVRSVRIEADGSILRVPTE